MNAEQIARAASIIDDKERLVKSLRELTGNITLLVGYRRNSCTGTNLDYTFPLDSQGQEELKIFLRDQFNRCIGEIDKELADLGVEVVDKKEGSTSCTKL